MPSQTALEKYKAIAGHLKRGVPVAEIARTHGITERTLWRWLKQVDTSGLPALQRKTRQDKGKRKSVSSELEQIIAGLILQSPAPTIASVHRTIKEICSRNGWKTPSYRVVHDIGDKLSSGLLTLAHQGEKAYRQAFDIIIRRESERQNEIWQADHTPLDILILDGNNDPKKPVLTAVIDDYSRAVAGYYLSFEPPSSVRVALALRQAIWRKEEPSWTICGIPDKLYTDRGSDFMSHHIDQVAIDLKFELIQSLPGQPKGRGKIERFFQTVTELFLIDQPGYAPGAAKVEATLTLEELEARFSKWLIDDYMQRVHSETGTTPKEKWESGAFLPRMAESREQLDLLLLTVAKPRRVQRDGIRFQGFRYFDLNLAGYVGEEVTIRYDPRDLAEIFVYAENEFVCRALCAELADQTVSLTSIIKTRNKRKKELQQEIKQLRLFADQHVQPVPTPITLPIDSPPAVVYPKFKIKRFACDD